MDNRDTPLYRCVLHFKEGVYHIVNTIGRTSKRTMIAEIRTASGELSDSFLFHIPTRHNRTLRTHR